MATLIFVPNDHLLAWVYHAPGVSPAAVVRVVRRGEWPFPPEWRAVLDEQFVVPEALRLRAQAHDDLVVVRPTQPLQERIPGRYVPLNPGQAQVLTLIARGMTTSQIARVMRVKRRWIKYRVAEVKRRLGALTAPRPWSGAGRYKSHDCRGSAAAVMRLDIRQQAKGRCRRWWGWPAGWTG